MQTLIKAIPNLINLVIVQSVFYLLFGIFCVSFYKGSLFYCSNVQDLDKVESKFDCLNLGGDWVNNPKNFDNAYNGIRTLFEVSTASWVQTMWDTVD